MINEELIRRVWKQIETDPRSWSQRSYVTTEPMRLHNAQSYWPFSQEAYARELEAAVAGCGTSYCFAGWTLQLEGQLDGEGCLTPQAQETEFGGLSHDNYPVAAMILLGINARQANALFHFYPTGTEAEQLAQMKERIEEVTGVKL